MLGCHAPALAIRRHRWQRRARATLALLAGALITLGLTALPASAGSRAVISDPDASPSWWAGVAGAGAGMDRAIDVVMAKGDATYVCGSLYTASGNADISLTKFLGDVKQWTRTWDGPGHFYDGANALALSPDGKWAYVAGSHVKADGTVDIVVLKRATGTGALKWARTYDGPRHKIDFPEAIGVDGRGNVVVAGVSENATDLDVLVVSWTPRGVRRWTWRYNGSGHGADSARGALVDRSGTTYITGAATVAGAIQATLTARISRTGKKVWAKTYKGPDAQGATATALARRPGGGVYVCGSVLRTAGHSDGMVLAYKPSGARSVFAFDTGSGGTTEQLFNDLAVASTGAIVAVGRGQLGAVLGCRAVVYRPDGTTVGSYSFSTLWPDEFRAVATDQFGGFYATGTLHSAALQARVFTWRGTVIPGGGAWQSRWEVTGSAANVPSAIAVRGTSACVVGGYASGTATGTDQMVLMFRY